MVGCLHARRCFRSFVRDAPDLSNARDVMKLSAFRLSRLALCIFGANGERRNISVLPALLLEFESGAWFGANKLISIHPMEIHESMHLRTCRTLAYVRHEYVLHVTLTIYMRYSTISGKLMYCLWFYSLLRIRKIGKEFVPFFEAKYK